MKGHEIVREAALEWMQRKGSRLGFSVLEEAFRADAYTQHEFRKNPTSKRTVKLSTLDLVGEVVVEDPDAFGEALRRGLGSAKAYGNGLMLVRRA